LPSQGRLAAGHGKARHDGNDMRNTHEFRSPLPSGGL
jgi:hypothetical protein